ncbi:alpha-glucuronidase family glycosyl hydrolase [Herbivorax sp. ANBcel31]|uniref:alpha-glucuronidase family glycosyl hydrolase n=1 Tax=Herbivorax sp. ANBcel31 TaxID=3069754 RepID=UPI0027AFB715|nr:alpha-glucuronidase family glycosyl hydrolase [Herbivorax sp. ANBcel31]MDQ2084866.1 alpha-glucuronidase family glycosyl hydrolase [Herbivorax sp. ANBcel31]
MLKCDIKKEDYKCWLKYKKIKNVKLLDIYITQCKDIITEIDTPIVNSAKAELSNGFYGMLGIKPSVSKKPEGSAFIVLGILGRNEYIDNEVLASEKDKVYKDGYLIKTINKNGKKYIAIASKTEKGILYGAYAFLRLMQMQKDIDDLLIIDNPHNLLRIVNHWDNIDGSIERGYAGESIFFEKDKIIKDKNRINDYARLLASVGINGVVINNVNVHEIESKLITKEYLNDVAKLSEVFRNYGVTLYLSINYASPIELGNLDTADPLDEGVKLWWKNKVKEIYDLIPDFGGFLVKADSEFRPGPFTYGRNHADGANMLAEALEPFGGIVIWRCFVYNCLQDWRDRETDRAKAAYDNFKPLDGLFHDNVLLQIKNGPMDFQVREPVSPLFGALEKTNHTIEFQVTQEYTGQQKHLCYLVPTWKEILDFNTRIDGENVTVKEIVNGSFFKNKYSGIAGVVNVGNDTNWTGHQLAQANLYGFGRLTWNPNLSSESITDEWVKMTFSNKKHVVDVIAHMLLSSRSIYENYTTPLGIGWMVNPGHHYGPNVDGYEYDKWGTYHRADINGIGVDRTMKTGTGYTGQYSKEITELYENMNKCPEELILFFHHVPYSYRLKSGVTLIQHIYNTHFEGVEQVKELIKKWNSLEGEIEKESFNHVLERLYMQLEHSKEWRDVVNTYFYRKTGINDELNRKIY